MSDTVRFGLEITLVGMSIVFAVLLAISGVVALMRRVDERWQRDEKLAEAAALERTPSLDDLTVVLVAAAVATLVAGRHRIRSIRRLMSQDSPSSAWASVGRAVLQGSHAVVRRR